jgi:hypothetical protein
MSFTAGKLRVLIATTRGPVEVQLLTEEDAAIGRCVACIGGTTETADIASAYHAFVVRPTGVIEGRFGHSCYRLDVSDRIDAGSSWQLGVLAAHALLAVGRLAQENDVADGILWVTGSVRPVDLTVGAVGHVPEKLANSLDRLKQELSAGRPALLAIPAGNSADVSPSAAKELLELGAELVMVSHAQALFDVLDMKLPGVPSKGPAAAVGAALVSGPAVVAAKPRRRIYAWVAAVALIGVAGAGATVLTGMPRLNSLLAQAGRTAPPPTSALAPEPQAGGYAPPPLPASAPAAPRALSPVSAPASQRSPLPDPVTGPAASPPATLPPGPRRVELVPETIPFLRASDRQRIRDEYLPAPNYKALAMTMFMYRFVTGKPSQEAADKAAMEACENNKPRSPNDSAVKEIEHRCELYASGTAVVSLHTSIPMPPMPWANASVQRPFVSAELPITSAEGKDSIERQYPRSSRSKALVIAPNGHVFTTTAEVSPEEAMRRGLERCGYISRTPCLVIAVDDSFVTTVPTLAKAVGFYRQDALFGVPMEERAEIARQLAASNKGWQAVALGAANHVGIEVGAASERSAIDGALENCALYDHDCRVVVIGPFLVDLPSSTPAAPPAQAGSPAPTASSTPPAPPSNAPPATTAPSASHAPPPAAAAPSASTVPPAFRAAPEARSTKQTTYER